MAFTTTDYNKFKEIDVAKINFLMGTILKLRINATDIEHRVNFFFPFKYDDIWIENCDGYETR